MLDSPGLPEPMALVRSTANAKVFRGKTQDGLFTDSFKIISCVLGFFPIINAEDIQ